MFRLEQSARHSSKSGFGEPKCETFVKIRLWRAKMRDIRQNQALDVQNARHSSKSSFGEPKCETFVKIRLRRAKMRDIRQIQVNARPLKGSADFLKPRHVS